MAMKWCAPAGAHSDSQGKCIAATETCDSVNNVAITTVDACPNDAPDTKPSCSLCTLDGYMWCQDFELDWDEYAGSCVPIPASPPPHNGGFGGLDADTSASSSGSASGSASESSASESSESSSESDSSDDDVPPPPPPPPPHQRCLGRVIKSLDQCPNMQQAMSMGGRKWHKHSKLGWIIPLIIALVVCCCIRRRCKRRCRERCQQRCEQQRAAAAAQANVSAAAGGYPGAVALSVAATPSASGAPIALATPVATAPLVAPLVYSHDPQPAYLTPAAVSAPTHVLMPEIEMRALATPTAVMYPTLATGYTRLQQSE